jgi:hypothetical protein
MSNLSVQERSGVLVVDSRLVADKLGIAHKNLLATIEKYLDRIQSAFQVIAFETRKSERGKPERFAWLTEPQTTFLMTLSRNTDEVVQCKLELVEAFEKAKQVIKEVIPAHTEESTATPSPSLPSVRERLEVIRLGIELFEELGGCDPRTELMLKDHIRNILLEEKRKPALPGRVEWPVSDRAVVLGHRPTPVQLRKIGKEAARLYQERHGQKPVQREQFVGGATRMVNVYGEADVDLLDEAVALVMEGIQSKQLVDLPHL